MICPRESCKAHVTAAEMKDVWILSFGELRSSRMCILCYMEYCGPTRWSPGASRK